jgi:serine/threonine protein kinase
MSESPPTDLPTGAPQVPHPVEIPMCGPFCNDFTRGYDFKSIHCKIPGCKSCPGSCILTIDEILGEGAYGKVFRVKHESDGKFYAIKVFNRKSEYQPAAQKEAAILTLVKGSPYVINIIADFEENNGCCTHFCLLLPFFEMSLYDSFENVQKDRSITLDILKKVISLLLGMMWIHEKGFLHCDLKPENILVGLLVVICDLGSGCKILIPHLENKTSPSYRAPELMSKRVTYGTASDVWALGCVIVELLLDKTIFNEMTDEYLQYMQLNIIRIIRAKFEELYSRSDVEKIVLFLTPFFQYKPEERGKIKDILEHPFLHEAIGEVVSKKRHNLHMEPSSEEPSSEEPSSEEHDRPKKAPRVRDLLSPVDGAPHTSPPLVCPFARLMEPSPFTTDKV